jgi:hypothetical protein
MPQYLKYLPACYRLFLLLYPSGLRTAYGDEMAAAFQQIIQDQYRIRGTRGVAVASAHAFGEFFTVALPMHLVSDWLIAASLSLVITSSVLGSLVGIMTYRFPIVEGVVHGCR